MSYDSAPDSLPAEQLAALHRVLAADPLPPAEQVERLWETTHRALAARRDLAPVVHRARTRRTPMGLLMGATALGVTLCIAVGAFLLSGSPRAQASAAHVYHTGVGERQQITLGDGSRVMLAPMSRLEVPRTFSNITQNTTQSASRRVTLDGEAFFDVTPAPNVPFVVHVGSVHVRVLGTTFDVRRYATDTAVHVAVLSGKVAIGSPRAEATVTAGSVGIATDSTATAAPANVDSYAGWVNGELVFTNAPVRTMLGTVGRWYGYDFKLSDSALASTRVTATFRAAESQKTLSAIAHLLKATMTIDGSTITLRPRRAEDAPRTRAERDRLPTYSEQGR